MKLFDIINNNNNFSPILISIETWCALMCTVMLIFVVIVKISDRRKENASKGDIRIHNNPVASERTSFLLIMLICAIVIMASDVLAMSYVSGTAGELFWISRITNFVLFASEYIVTWVFFRYLISIIEYCGQKVSLLWRVMGDIVTIASIVNLLISQFTGWFYYFDEYNVYHRSGEFWKSEVTSVLMIVIFFAVIIKYSDVLTKRKLWSLLVIFLCPMIAVITQLFFYGFSIMALSFVVSVSIAFFEFVITRAWWITNTKDLDKDSRLKTRDSERIVINAERARSRKHVFIVNPLAGGYVYAKDLRERLSKITDLEYFIFVSREEGGETELVRRVENFFKGLYIRIYSCGGSGTFRNVISGITDFEHVEVAFYPCGMTNDFLKCFGDDVRLFTDVDRLINGETMNVDYIKTEDGIAINTFSTGLDIAILNPRYRRFGIFGKNIPYLIGIIAALLSAKPVEYEVEVDGKEYTGKYSEILLAKGMVIGGVLHIDEKARINTGKAMFLLEENRWGIMHIPVLFSSMRKDFERLRSCVEIGDGKTMKVRRKDGKSFMMMYDGEFGIQRTEWSAEVVKEGLRFVIPDGVNVYEG